MRVLRFGVLAMLAVAAMGDAGVLSVCGGATLEVGPGKRYRQIEKAVDAARPGDEILIYPLEGHRPYEKVAIFVRQKQLTIRGMAGDGARWVKISGKGFEYSGSGSTPRAIIQFNPGTDHCVVEGLELTGAHNESENGAGVRINGANHITIRHCSIHDNDMGIMSNGDGSLTMAVNQRIEHCEIHHNGNERSPGYNHNLYLGGTSVLLAFCDIHHSLTGHNVKSRSHQTRVQYCYVHDSCNREFDLVDSGETTRPGSDAVLMGNIIAKDPACRGNRTVIHFGQDGGKEHDGTVHLVFNTIVTPFIAPVVDLSSPKAKARWIGNLVSDGGTRQNGQKVVAVRAGDALHRAAGHDNWFSGDFGSVGGTDLDPKTNVFRRAKGPLFVDASKHNYRLVQQEAQGAVADLQVESIDLPRFPGMAEADEERALAWQYRHPLGKEKRAAQSPVTLGAYGSSR